MEIAQLVGAGYTVHMQIIPGPEFTTNTQAQNSISKTSVLFVSISFIVLMVISLAWLVFYYIQRFRYSHAKERLAVSSLFCLQLGLKLDNGVWGSCDRSRKEIT